MKKIVVPGASSLNQSKKGDGGTKQRGERERETERQRNTKSKRERDKRDEKKLY